MNLLDRDTEQLISDYVANRLSDEELEQFELELFENAELVEKVEAAQLLRANLLMLDVNESTSEQRDIAKESSSIFGSLMTRDVPRYLVLALLILPIGVSFIDFGKQPDSLVVGAPNLIRFSNTVTRGVSKPLELDLANVSPNSVLLIKVVENQYPRYQLILTDTDSDEKVWSSAEFELSNLGDSLVGLPDLGVDIVVRVTVIGLDESDDSKVVKYCNYSASCWVE